MTKRASTLASSSSTEGERFPVGRLGRPHGLDGFLGFYIEEEDVVAVQPGSTVFVGGEPHVVRVLRRVDRGYQIAFEDVDDRTTAEKLRGSDVLVPARRQLEEGEFWPGDLIGLDVFDETGRSLGSVADVRFGAGQDRLVVEDDDGRSFEVPFVEELVPVVDLDHRRVEIRPIPGLTEP